MSKHIQFYFFNHLEKIQLNMCTDFILKCKRYKYYEKDEEKNTNVKWILTVYGIFSVPDRYLLNEQIM
jgi:hypothetical protein